MSWIEPQVPVTQAIPAKDPLPAPYDERTPGVPGVGVPAAVLKSSEVAWLMSPGGLMRT